MRFELNDLMQCIFKTNDDKLIYKNGQKRTERERKPKKESVNHMVVVVSKGIHTLAQPLL